MANHRAQARSRLASTLSEAAKALPPADRVEFRAFLRSLERGESFYGNAIMGHASPKLVRAKFKKARPRPPKQKELFDA